jgi:hypothetical protein
MGDSVGLRIGCWAGFWGDSTEAAAQVLHDGAVDVLVADHLAEITMALLARAKARTPEGGYVADAVEALVPLLADVGARGVKVITNAGGLNPRACAAALASASPQLRVAAVVGDDLTCRHAELRAAGAVDMFTGEALPERVLTMNAYLGARPIVAALDRGADVVVTGRCADSALTLAPLVHHFGWDLDDFDLLSAGSLVGHLLECGPQVTGGLATDWDTVPGWDRMGYPIAECAADGTAIITKPAGTGGRVDRATVAEQLVYEIGDPGNYLLPDVACDWREVVLDDIGRDRVRVSGARGRPPTGRLKVTTTVPDGFRLLTSATFAGGDATGRARRAGQAALDRAERIATARGLAGFTDRSVEVVGSGDLTGRRRGASDEAVVKLAARHESQEALDILAREVAPLALVAQGMTGLTAGRARPAPSIRLVHLLVDARDVPAEVHLDGTASPAERAERVAPESPTPPLVARSADGVGERRLVALREIAVARSGDKGNDVNIGVVVRHPDLFEVLCEELDERTIREAFAHVTDGEVRRWALPGIGAVNILLTAALGGGGGTSSLRLDPQGKSFGAILLDQPIACPVDLLERMRA